MQHEIKRTPEEWAALIGVKILDPDGWRGSGGADFKAPCTWDQFLPRLNISTIMAVGKNRLADIPEFPPTGSDLT